MNVRWLTVLALILAATLGCGPARRRHDAYQELLDAEKRYLEDQLYDLDYEYGILQDKYHSAVRENETLRRTLQENRNGGAAGSRDETLPGDDRLRPPTDLDGITPPQIELGQPSPPALETPPITPPADLLPGQSPEDAGSEGIPLAPPTEDSPIAPPNDDFPTDHKDLIDPRVTHIQLNPLLTGGADLDDRPGDDGVALVVEPRNAADQYVAVAGPLSIVVIDPARQGEAARLARWDFTAHETREMMDRAAFGKGIHLHLPWPHEYPANPRLRLFVRYTTPEGEKLEADREFFVELPGQVSARWTPLAPEPDAAGGPIDASQHVGVEPGAAMPRTAANPQPRPNVSPPPGRTVSEQDDRPQWRPYR